MTSCGSTRRPAAVGQYEMDDGVATWQAIGTAGADWDVIA